MGLFGGGSGADWLIAGLGNPEPKYDGTRHNTGFAALDALGVKAGSVFGTSVGALHAAMYAQGSMDADTLLYNPMESVWALLGDGASARAVGGAVGRNPISIIVPCHRVIGADGSMTGYAGGVDRKICLLALERQGTKRR